MNRRALLLCLLLPAIAPAQTRHELMMLPQEHWAQAKAGSEVEVKIGFELRSGFHVNSNAPSEKYLIPFRLTWDAGSLKPLDVIYPKPHDEKYSFSKEPLSVFTDMFTLAARFQVPANTPSGATTLTGKVRYQACNDRACQPPRTLDIKVQVNVSK